MQRILFNKAIGLFVCAIAFLLCSLSAFAVTSADFGRQILVLGGTGELGSEIVRLLVKQGDHVSVYVRRDSDRSKLNGLTVDFLDGNLLNQREVAVALYAKKFFAIINAVRVDDGDEHFYEKVMGNTLPAAKANGVVQILHHSAVGAGDNASQFLTLGWGRVPGLLPKLKDQGIGEMMLRRSGIYSTIMRNARLYPAGTPATGYAQLTEDTSVLTPMTRADLAQLTVSCVGNSLCYDKIYHVRDLSLVWPMPIHATP